MITQSVFDKKVGKMSENNTDFYEKSKKEMSDLMNCYIIFWVFHGIKFSVAVDKKYFPWKLRKIWRTSHQITHLVFQLLTKITSDLNNFPTFYQTDPERFNISYC